MEVVIPCTPYCTEYGVLYCTDRRGPRSQCNASGRWTERLDRDERGMVGRSGPQRLRGGAINSRPIVAATGGDDQPDAFPRKKLATRKTRRQTLSSKSRRRPSGLPTPRSARSPRMRPIAGYY